jgi:hypothetical protein
VLNGSFKEIRMRLFRGQIGDEQLDLAFRRSWRFAGGDAIILFVKEGIVHMSVEGINEKDWKLFRKKMPEWQERYMGRLCDEYAEILNKDDNPSEKFWTLLERLKKDRYDVGVSAEMSRSKMHRNIASLVSEGAITIDDMDGFSEVVLYG